MKEANVMKRMCIYDVIKSINGVMKSDVIFIIYKELNGFNLDFKQLQQH